MNLFETIMGADQTYNTWGWLQKVCPQTLEADACSTEWQSESSKHSTYRLRALLDCVTGVVILLVKNILF